MPTTAMMTRPCTLPYGVLSHQAGDLLRRQGTFSGGHIKTVESLLEGGAKMELTNSRNLTALGEAITVKNAHIVEMLIDKGADVRRISKGCVRSHFFWEASKEEWNG